MARAAQVVRAAAARVVAEIGGVTGTGGSAVGAARLVECPLPGLAHVIAGRQLARAAQGVGSDGGRIVANVEGIGRIAAAGLRQGPRSRISDILVVRRIGAAGLRQGPRSRISDILVKRRQLAGAAEDVGAPIARVVAKIKVGRVCLRRIA